MESIKLEKFKSMEIKGLEFILGGTSTDTPSGGCVCDTVGGTIVFGAGSNEALELIYKSDKQAYLKDGSLGIKDYQG